MGVVVDFVFEFCDGVGVCVVGVFFGVVFY